MKITEIRQGHTESVVVECAVGEFDPPPPARAEARLVMSSDDVLLEVAGAAWTVQGASARGDRALRETAVDAQRFIVSVAHSSAGAVTLFAREFASVFALQDPLVVAVDTRAQDEIRRHASNADGMAGCLRWLEDEFVIAGPPGGDAVTRRIIASPEAGGHVSALRLYGRRFSMDLRLGENGLLVERLIRGHSGASSAVRLLRAPIELRDASDTGPLAASTRAMLNEAVRASGSYLEIWRRYAELEREQVELRASRFGRWTYSKGQRSGARYSLELDKPDDAATHEYLCEQLASLVESNAFLALGALDSNAQDDSRETLAVREVRGLTVELASIDDERLPAIPARGTIELSTLGDKTRAERRVEAERRIRSGTCAKPRLGLLLEGKPFVQVLHKSHEPMSATARAVFGRAPTERQIKAVSVAINAPDIAMIQGPPGTGKTSVIAAIQHRLAELDGDTEGLRHRVLVTSAQHDAVENVAVRTQVVGLPAMKIGRRRRGDSEGIDAVDVYREEQAGKLRAGLESNHEYSRLRDARAHIAAALAQPGTPLDNAANLERVLHIAGDLIPAALSDRLLDRVRELRQAAPVEGAPRAVARAAAAALRSTRVAFEDDGPKQAAKALHRCDPWLEPAERALLERCRDWAEVEAPGWIADVTAVRNALLDRLAPPVETPSRSLDDATHALLHAVIDAVRGGLVERRTREEAALEELLYEIEHAPGAVREALEEYTAVLAATLQQSAAKSMRSVTQTRDGSGVEFDTVIVDEAARAHPLDLFIPMGMARRRIVLVGDHRQLPHMLEPEVESALREGDLPAETERALRDSLFQRLWDLMKAREALDGIPRTVMLDEQFRMHPALGDFVSAQFYERKGDQVLRSPRGAEEFAHGLSLFRSRRRDAAAAWVDVSSREGGELRGESKSRPVEARRVAELAKNILDEDSSLSVGVISFYRAQVTQIADELRRFGIVERDEKGWSIADAYRVGRDRFERPMERLRVGTVDAFQGKEFDVVLLSITRSNALPQNTDADVRRKYGHLLLDNRLCVAMSRQRRLLVAVGDLDFVRNAERLPALRAFAELCEGEHGVIR